MSKNINVEQKGSFIVEDYKTKARFRNKKLFKYLMQLKPLLFTALLLTLLSSLIELVGPLILARILDEELVNFIGARNRSNFYFLVLAYFLVMFLSTGISLISHITFSKLSNGVTRNIRKDTFSHVMSLPVQFFDKYAIGKIVNRITNDTKDIRVLFQLLFSQILVIFIKSIGLIVTLFALNWRLGLISLLASPLIIIIFKDFFNKSTRYQRDSKSYRSDLNGNLAETIQTMEIVQAFNKEDQIYDEFSYINDQINKVGWKSSILWSYSSWNITSFIGNLVNAGALALVGYYFLKDINLISVGTLYVFIEYNMRIFSNVRELMNQVGQLESSKSAADQIFELQRIESFEEGDKTLDDMKGYIKFDDVTFAYNDDDYVVHNLSFEIPQGTSAAFVGHTGSGKSTVMNLLYKFYKINMGKIYIDGVDINELDMESVRGQMAIVFQNPYIFEGTVYDNISLFDKSITKEEAEEALISVGGSRILQKEAGIDARVGEGGSGFSSGERQIISFARAMVRNPKILVLDEATANVDTETEELIQFGLNKLKQGRTTLIIAHRLSTIKDSDRIYLLENGNIVETGKHEELMALDGKYANMYRNS